MSLAVTYLIPAYMAFVVMGTGHWLAGRTVRRFVDADLGWIERLCLGALWSLMLLGLLGLAVVLVPHGARALVARTLLVLLAAWSALCMWRGGWSAMRAAQPAERVFALGFAALCVLATALALLPARLPATLADGPYVTKHDLLGVHVQYTTGNLPPDNAIPHVVSEYLLRDISFRTERPLMPGQEVTNRPILAGVVIAAFRAATYLPAHQEGPLPRFAYVGTQWPDFSVLMRDEPGYRVSQAVGIALNALLLLGAGALVCGRRPVTAAMALAATALYLSSPYFLFQTYFTWPKALAGFLIIVGWQAAVRWRAPFVSGAALGMAYLSHPFAIAYFMAHVAWQCWAAWADSVGAGSPARSRAAVVRGCTVVAGFVLVTIPWFLWTWTLKIPGDLVAQNLLVSGQDVGDFLWVRITNILSAALPVHMLRYPFDLGDFVRASALNASGAVGAVLVMVLAGHLRAQAVPGRVWCLWALPALALICVFSSPAVALLHGLQPLAAALVVTATANLWRRAGPVRAGLLVTGQVAVNGALLLLYYSRLL